MVKVHYNIGSTDKENNNILRQILRIRPSQFLYNS